MSSEQVEPFVWNHLLAALDVYRQEHESLFAQPVDEEGRSIAAAVDAIERHAYRVLRTGEVEGGLRAALESFKPHLPFKERLEDLGGRLLVVNRLEFDVAEDAIWRLESSRRRIGQALVILGTLLEAAPSPIAVKYHERAARLYLAGFDSESVIMCGAVLEAALAARFPDEMLLAAGLRPRYEKTGVFSVGQRMRYERDHPLFEDKQRDAFWVVVNARNDVVHVDPDLGVTPIDALALTALLLAVILPAER